MNILVVGAGVVGTRHGDYLKSLGHNVLYFDTHVVKRKALARNYELYLPKNGVAKFYAAFICVPTPIKPDGSQDYRMVLAAVNWVSKRAKCDTIFVKSTVLPYTISELIARYRKKGINIASNPEFLTEIRGSWTEDENFEVKPETERFVLIGANLPETFEKARKIYGSDRIIFLTPTEAEVAKYASNCLLAAKISYWNALFDWGEQKGLRMQKIAEILGRDERIGKYGTVCGKAFGGKCLPKDLAAFAKFTDIALLKEVEKINLFMREKYGVRE